MKIEKLTENKIRIIVNDEDLDNANTDLHSIMTKAISAQGIVYEMLEKAKKEVGFYTDGCKLLIEASSFIDGVLVFTITKFSCDDGSKINEHSLPKKRLTIKRKLPNVSNKQLIYRFDSFDDFCEFCNGIYMNKLFDVNRFSKNVSLYLYNDTYYLIVKNIDIDYNGVSIFYLIGSEFGKLLFYSETFENKLIEHGKVLAKKNAFKVWLNFFDN